ncbi:hypothetical protein OS493_032673 [Desmophyllum pertusum]|uniref:DUF6589 domain-containing protein n=1 Tax=Desmophyllum pertusum TaxID=174260 RepID=A0A9X0CEM3_9CNID|nr:hypothetical protein OS493_032673 [Desmophyllum pertusum]
MVLDNIYSNSIKVHNGSGDFSCNFVGEKERKLINDVLMKQSSAREIETLKYFRERIMRYNVPTTVKNNPDAYEEFFTSVGRAYLVEAFLEFFGMDNTESVPTKNMPENNATMEEKKQHFDNVIGQFVDYHVFHSGVSDDDKVMNYGLCLIELFVIPMQVNDTVHEVDGDRNVINWKYLLWLFKANNNLSKYAIEGMYFLTLVKCLLTHQMSERVIWGRETNKKGKIATNMPNDLEMEHNIKDTKTMITAMGANKTEKSVLRCSMSVTGMREFLSAFDATSNHIRRSQQLNTASKKN